MAAVRIALLSLALAAGGALASAAILGFPTTGTDDANITFVYARNLANGHGLVYTPGYERVEGFTSLGWMLVCSAVIALLPTPEPALFALSGALAAAAAAAAFAVARRLGAGAPLAWIALAVWLAASPGFWAWTGVSLMDVALFAAVVNGLALALVCVIVEPSHPGARLGLAALCALAVLTRPEAMALVPGALVGGVLATRARTPALRDALRPYRPAFLAFAGTLAALVLFRLAYFGHPLPNTYYAKVPESRSFAASDGLAYLWDFVVDQPLVLLLVLPLGAALRPLLRLLAARPVLGEREAGAFAVATIGVLGLLLPLFGGGDHMGSSRMFQPFVPLLAVPAVVAVGRLRLTGRTAIAAGLVAVLAVGFAWDRFATRHRMALEFDVAARGRQLGRALNPLVDEAGRPRLGAVAAGGLAYTYEGRVIDLMGLNWTAMGHSRGDRRGARNHAAFDPEVFWTDPPDLVNALPRAHPPRSACDLFNPFRERVLKGLFFDARFQAHYVPATLRLPEGLVGGFFARDWIESASPAGLTPLRGGHCRRER